MEKNPEIKNVKYMICSLTEFRDFETTKSYLKIVGRSDGFVDHPASLVEKADNRRLPEDILLE